jgi:hypothetical protein
MVHQARDQRQGSREHERYGDNDSRDDAKLFPHAVS